MEKSKPTQEKTKLAIYSKSAGWVDVNIDWYKCIGRMAELIGIQ